MKTLITSDTHFSHANIIRYCKRPWLDPADLDELGDWKNKGIARLRANEMDEALIANWNSVVAPGDLVYHLGDLLFGRDEHDFDRILNRLNGDIILIKGNHDKLTKQFRHKFAEYHHSGLLETTIEGQKVTLCHYAMKTWNKSHRGTFHLYGHSHGTLPDDPNSLSFDAGIDCNNYFPFTWPQVKARMAKKTFKPIDHHGDND